MDFVQQLRDLVNSHSKSYSHKLKAKSYKDIYGKLYNFILFSTPLLDNSEYTLATRVYWILNGITSFDDFRCCCHHCHKNGQHRNVRNVFAGYTDFCCKKCMHDSDQRKNKYKEVCLKKFGVENASQSAIVKDKKRMSSLSKYGVDNPAKAAEVKQKTQNTNMSRYNAKCSFQNEAVKEKCIQTILKNYNVRHPLQNSNIAQKAQATTYKHYGVKYPMLSHEIRAKAKQKYCFDNIWFDSKPELALYVYLKDNNIDFTYQPDMHFTYMCNGIQYFYFPDFVVNNQVIEVKGRHFFKEDGTMCNPFAHYQDDIYEAKHQCMMRNNVKILLDDSAEICKALEYAKAKYGKDYLDKFKKKICK